MKTFTALAASTALKLVMIAGPAIAAPVPPQPPAGAYILDKTHTSVTFRVNHLGFSRYTARFSSIDGRLKFDPAAPATMSVDATIDPLSLELNAPPKGFHDELTGKAWFNAAAFPAITFHSTKVEVTGANTARVTGDLSLHGVTRPVTLEVTYNGGWPPNSFDPGGARIGFSAHGAFKRSAFGMGMGIPAPGSTMGVGDEVEVMIETEFSSKVPPAAK
ncbi:YceI family protein [Phenylobacterium sp.]|uniref:YceI family protein n=1 Tax=Phenylobacterium sp. TaxID=1871053 RepID=UPI00286C8A69|nr:YceI family protein [Phenylobacterium sp.]